MIRFSLFGFPVSVHWLFWLMAALLGGAADASGPTQLMAVGLFVAVVFVSIVVHELGHAFAMRHFGDRMVEITLYTFGGFARGSAWRSRREDILVCAAGPAFGALLALLAWVVLSTIPLGNRWLVFVFVQLLWVNIVWTIFNLLPIYPMDGGRISMALFGTGREDKSLKLSLVCALALALWQLSRGSLWNTLLIASFAVDNFKMLKHQPRIEWMKP